MSSLPTVAGGMNLSNFAMKALPYTNLSVDQSRGPLRLVNNWVFSLSQTGIRRSPRELQSERDLWLSALRPRQAEESADPRRREFRASRAIPEMRPPTQTIALAPRAAPNRMPG